MYTLEDLERIITTLEEDSSSNVTKLDQAIQAMKHGKVGETILANYYQILDQAKVIEQAAQGVQGDIGTNKMLRDVRASVPDAGDNAYLTLE